jgi:hypothetical protein
MVLNRRHFLGLGAGGIGAAAGFKYLSFEQKADAVESQKMKELNDAAPAPKKIKTAAELEAEIPTRTYRRGVGKNFVPLKDDNPQLMKLLEPMPAKPTFQDFFRLRFQSNANHSLQSANVALKKGMPEDVVLACLLHDTVHALMRTDHGYWGAQLYAPYVSEKVAWAIQYHQALRFFDDDSVGYKVPVMYQEIFGEGFVPPPHIKADADIAKKHKWYEAARAITLNDLYSFEKGVVVSMDPFIDIIGRHFKNPAEGLGNDGSPVVHMWRTIASPDLPL